MTLHQWEDHAPIDALAHRDGARWIPDALIPPAIRPTLWRLEDFRVSSVSGGSIWLTPTSRHDTGGKAS
jgi:hypothetical protein